MINWLKNLFHKKTFTDYRKQVLEKYNIPEDKLEAYRERESDNHTIKHLAIWYFNDRGKHRYFSVINKTVYEL